MTSEWHLDTEDHDPVIKCESAIPTGSIGAVEDFFGTVKVRWKWVGVSFSS